MKVLPHIQLAVISDLHIGDAAKTDDFKPGAKLDPRAGYLLEFAELVSEEKLKADFLVVSGDITDKAYPAQALHASEIIAQIAKILGAHNILAIPGNHDLNWKVCELDEAGEDFWSGLRYAPLQMSATRLQEWLSHNDQSLLKTPFFTLRDTGDALVCSYNSAAFDLPSKKPHWGAVRQGDLEQMDKALHLINFEQEKLRICLVHHHPVNYSNVDPAYPDFSILTNAGNFLKVLTDHRFDLLIHGHKHFPFFHIYSNDMCMPLAMLGAGSFSVKLTDTIYQGRVTNQFHLVDVQGRDQKSNLIYGAVKSWAHVFGSGWTPSRQKYHGIPHISSFGKYQDLAQIENELQSVINHAKASSPWMDWNQLVSAWPDAKYIPTTVLHRALESLKSSIGFRVHGLDTGLEELVLLF